MQTTNETITRIEELVSKICYGTGSTGDNCAEIAKQLDDLRWQLQTERAELRDYKSRLNVAHVRGFCG
jgi:hypothetical protein